MSLNLLRSFNVVYREHFNFFFYDENVKANFVGNAQTISPHPMLTCRHRNIQFYNQFKLQ